MGPLNIKKKKIKSKLYSAKRNIDPKYLKKYKDIISKELKIGDASKNTFVYFAKT